MNRRPVRKVSPRFTQVAVLCVVLLAPSIQAIAQTQSGGAQSNDYLFNDTHFHLTNYIQEGVDIRDFLKIMGFRRSPTQGESLGESARRSSVAT